MNNLYLLVGESGSGKSTIAAELEKRYHMTQLQSYTTRPMRNHNETGHIFVSDNEFDQLKDLVAYTHFCGHRYGVTAKQIEESDIYIVDPDGIIYFKEHYQGNKAHKVIYIHVPEKERKQRMYSRGDNKLTVGKRIANDKIKFKNVSDFADVLFYNHDMESSVEEIHKYIEIQEKLGDNPEF